MQVQIAWDPAELIEEFTRPLRKDGDDVEKWATQLADAALQPRPSQEPEVVWPSAPSHIDFRRENFLSDLVLLYQSPGKFVQVSARYPRRPESRRERASRYILVELREAFCSSNARYAKEVAELSKNAKTLVLAISGYVAGLVGLGAAVVAALVAAAVVLAVKLGFGAFCEFMKDEEGVHRMRMKALHDAGIPELDHDPSTPTTHTPAKQVTRSKRKS